MFMKIEVGAKPRARFKDKSACTISFFEVIVSIGQTIELLKKKIEYT